MFRPMLYFESNQGAIRERRYADHIFIQIYFRMPPFRSQIFTIFFALGGNGALTPLTKIPRTFLITTQSISWLGWRRGVVVSGVRRMNEVNARLARLVAGWVTVFGRVYHLGM